MFETRKAKPSREENKPSMRIHANSTLAKRETSDMQQETDLTQPLHPGDVITIHATGHLRQATITRVTPTYVSVEYTSPSTGYHHNTSYRRYRPGVKPPKEQP
jgi:hypothetical protein